MLLLAFMSHRPIKVTSLSLGTNRHSPEADGDPQLKWISPVSPYDRRRFITGVQTEYLRKNFFKLKMMMQDSEVDGHFK